VWSDLLLVPASGARGGSKSWRAGVLGGDLGDQYETEGGSQWSWPLRDHTDAITALQVRRCEEALGSLGGWVRVGSEDLFAVGAAGFGGAVGVEDELPAAAVNTDIMMELTH
jgi:hypothetical protein